MSKKPWMVPKSGESHAQFNCRLARTCYACGHESPTRRECDEHEEDCPRAQQGKGKK